MGDQVDESGKWAFTVSAGYDRLKRLVILSLPD